MIRLRLLLILLGCLLTSGGVAAPRPEMVRVAVLKGADKVTVDGEGAVFSSGDGQPLPLQVPLELRRVREGLSVNGMLLPRLVARGAAKFRVNGKGYRGVLEISAADKGVLVVDELPLEDYLVGLINCEISSAWPMEAIKAQAVIARSYAMFQKAARKDAPYQLESSVMDQVYEGCDLEDGRATRGVRETAGEMISFGGKTIQAFYHSNCAGHTESSEQVWGTALPYLRGVTCQYCQDANPIHWELTVPLKKLEAALKAGGYPVPGVREVRVAGRNESGRVQQVLANCSKGLVMVPGVAFRKALGYSAVKSTMFDLRLSGDEVTITGEGNGHGVGLCQWGAKQRALEGFSYREILTYYYPGVQISRAGE